MGCRRNRLRHGFISTERENKCVKAIINTRGLFLGLRFYADAEPLY